MCGRIACALSPDIICHASSYKDPSSGTIQKPSWKDHPTSKDPGNSYTYYPSANAAPTRFTPVMYKTQTPNEDSNVFITPMMFGMIPSYHKGDAKSHGLSTNNCRLENLLNSKIYNRVLQQRKLCVILAQGFYEWKTVGCDSKTGKQPYLIFAPQEDKSHVADTSVWEQADKSYSDEWKGPKLLKMAGLYDIWESPSGDKVYSYTVITMDSNDTLSWLHDRMPAILESDEQTQSWLNATTKTDTNELLSILKPAKALDWYPVDTKVGNSRCHDMDCMNPYVAKENKSKTFMDNWLKKKPGEKKKADSSTETENSGPVEKKPKLEEN